MARRDPHRTQKLRIAIRYLLERESLAKGNQTRLAEHFNVSRQRVHQIVVEERRRFDQTHNSAHNGVLPAGAGPLTTATPLPQHEAILSR